MNIQKINLPPLAQMLSFLIALSALGGSFIYFALPFEPSLPIVAMVSISCFLLACLCQRFYPIFLTLLLISLLAGFCGWSAWVMQYKNTTFLPVEFQEKRVWVVGQISQMGTFDNRTKVTLTHNKIYGLPDFDAKIRVSADAKRLSVFDIGDWVALEAKLYPPRGPQFEGDFDGRRHAYIKGIGASGYVFGQIYATSWPEGSGGDYYRLHQQRKRMTQQVLDGGDTPESKGVMAALLTGNRNFIPEHIYQAYRETGLAHVLAISGLHVGLVTGFVFLLIRRMVGCHPRVIQTLNTKKIAAVMAFFAAGGYTLLAGATLPTLRAFMMVSFVLLAILVGRLRWSLHYLYVTVTVVILLWPESILQASFQMSFAAVFALLLWMQASQKGDTRHAYGDIGMYIKGVIVTSIVASLATLPIVAWHFGMISLSGVVMNLIAMPLTAFWILPAGVVALMLMPVGLENIPLWLMDKGVFLMNSWTLWGQELPSSGILVYGPDWLYVSILALVCLICFLWRGVRVFMVACAVSCAVLFLKPLVWHSSPKLITLDDGDTVLLASDKYVTHLVGEKRSSERYARQVYGERFPVKNIFEYPDAMCDQDGCVLQVGRRRVLVSLGMAYHVEDCLQTDLVLSQNKTDKKCPGYFLRQGRSSWWSFDGQQNVYDVPSGRIWD